MTAIARPAPHVAHRPNPVAQSLALSRRAVAGIFRQPQVLFPSLFFPLMFAALNSAAFARTPNLPGFPPVDSYLDFLLPATIVQGVLLGATSAGIDMAVDLEGGFFDRLLASPVARTSVLVGRLAGAAVLGAVQALVFVLVLTPFGARVHGGVPGLALLMLIGMVLAVAIGGLGVALALRTGSSEAVQGAFPVIFVLLFTSSAFFPRQLMNGWYGWLADHNPLSFLIEGARHVVTVGWDLGEALQAVLIGLAFCVLSIGLALLALRRRLRVAA